MTANNTAKIDVNSDEFKALVEAQVAEQLKAKVAEGVAEALAKQEEQSGYKGYATKAITPKITMFSQWLVREFPDMYPAMSARDIRLISMSIRTYKFFQAEVNGRTI